MLGLLFEAAADADVVLRFDPEETTKHGLEPGPHVAVDAEISRDVDLCIVLGGDGTILRALREYVGTDVPVFAVNFGEIGFLATLDPGQMRPDFAGAFDLRFEVLRLPVLELEGTDGMRHAINDVAVHRRAGMRVAELAYEIAGETVGSARADALVVCTPAGSTGYNLANGGPIMAWGVEGFAISFVAAHSLAARSLVIAPDEALVVRNLSREEPVDVAVDGRPAGEIPPEGSIEVRLLSGQSSLAQLAGVSFYGRLREKFDRLSR